MSALHPQLVAADAGQGAVPIRFAASAEALDPAAVSYTHLTLPTKRIV